MIAQAAYLLIIGLQKPQTWDLFVFMSEYFSVVVVLMLADLYMYVYMQL